MPGAAAGNTDGGFKFVFRDERNGCSIGAFDKVLGDVSFELHVWTVEEGWLRESSYMRFGQHGHGYRRVEGKFME
jgi:hypothetical protein